jgi:hypothetical protein
MAPRPQPELDPNPSELDHADKETIVPRVIVRQTTTRPASRNPTMPPFAAEMTR